MRRGSIRYLQASLFRHESFDIHEVLRALLQRSDPAARARVVASCSAQHAQATGVPLTELCGATADDSGSHDGGECSTAGASTAHCQYIFDRASRCLAGPLIRVSPT